MFRSIRSRLVLWYTGIIVITYIAVAVVIEQNLTHTLSDSLDQSIDGEMEWYTGTLSKLSDTSSTVAKVKDDIVNHVAHYYIKEYVDIYDSHGLGFFRTRNLENDSLMHYVSHPGDNGVRILTVKNFRSYDLRLAVESTPEGTIYVAMPQTIVTLPINHILEIFAWIGPIVVFVSIGGGFYLANKSLLKVNSVIEAVKLLTVERLHDRLPEHEVQDEIGRLISTFNEMIARLDFSFRQMKQFSADASHELRTPLAVLRA